MIMRGSTGVRGPSSLGTRGCVNSGPAMDLSIASCRIFTRDHGRETRAANIQAEWQSMNRVILSALTFLLLAESAQAQPQAPWPSRPVKILVPTAPGGT